MAVWLRGCQVLAWSSDLRDSCANRRFAVRRGWMKIHPLRQFYLIMS